MIIQVSDTSNVGFASKDSENRSEMGFAGIKNLGAVCYMNSIIQ